MEQQVRLVNKFIGLIILLLCSCHPVNENSSLTKPWFNETNLHLYNSNGLMMEESKPFTGMVYALAANGKDTLYVTGFANGKEDGEWRKYFDNGQLAEQRFYRDGVKTGILSAWWPNGATKLAYHFADGEYEGECQQWNAEGLLVANMHYHKGYEDGLQQQFYDNGKVKANYLMKGGRRYGLLGTKNCVNVSDSVFKKL